MTSMQRCIVITTKNKVQCSRSSSLFIPLKLGLFLNCCLPGTRCEIGKGKAFLGNPKKSFMAQMN